MSSNITSPITGIQFMDNIGIQVNVLSGTPTGTLSVQVSGDHAASLPSGVTTTAGNWITLTTGAITSGSPAQTFFNLNLLAAPFVRVIYTASSGSGTCDIFIVGKSI